MTRFPRCVCAVTAVLFSISSGYGQAVEAAPPADASPAVPAAPPASSSWLELLRGGSMEQSLESIFVSTAGIPVPPARPPALRTCAVAPLDPVEDAAARQLEAASGSEVVDVADMLPAAARALGLFQSKVAGIGGKMVLRSAYRPSAYQMHLQNVWYKWMVELRRNLDPACQALRAQVQDEFQRHRLMETQHPVALSDHTRGIAFDATVELPRNAHLGRRRLTLDGLAHLAGLWRPAIAADPVHFIYRGKSRTPVRRHNA